MIQPIKRLLRTHFALIIILLATVLIRIPSFAAPMWNLDEAFTAVAGRVVLEGGLPYVDTVDHRGPLTNYAFAAAFAVGGKYNMTAARVLLTLIVVYCTACVWRLGRAFGTRRSALIGAGIFAFVSTFAYQPGDLFAFHTEWCMLAFALPGVLLTLRAVRGRGSVRCALGAGVCMGLAFLSKQPAALDGAALGGWVLIGVARALLEGRRGRVWPLLTVAGGLAGGFVLVLFLFVDVYVAAGQLAEMKFYFFTYNTDYYAGIIPLSRRGRSLKEACASLWHGMGIGTAPLIALGAILAARGRRARGLIGLLLLWTCSSVLGAVLGGRNFGHYFLQAMPPLCILAGMGLNYAIGDGLPAGRPHRRLRMANCAAILALVIWILAGPVRHALMDNWTMYGLRVNAVRPDEDELIRRVQSGSGAAESIFIWGFRPDLYLRADRPPGSRFTYCTFLTGLVPWVNGRPGLDTSPWIVPGTMDQLLEDLGERRPTYFIDTAPGNHFQFGKYPIRNYPALFEYVGAHYELEAAIPRPDGTPSFDLYRRKANGG